MPSRILHLAVTARLTDALPFRDPARLRIGSVLPDAEILGGDPPVKIAHFPKYIDGGRRKTLGLSRFRAVHGECLLTDDLTLGYYLHLAGDIVQRQIFYNECGWNPVSREAVAALHRDYALLNPSVIATYSIRREESIPSADTLRALERDPLLAGFVFDLSGFFSDMERDFLPPDVPPAPEDFAFFTPALAEEWIRRTTELLVREVVSLRSRGTSLIDEDAMSWERKGRPTPR